MASGRLKNGSNEARRRGRWGLRQLRQRCFEWVRYPKLIWGGKDKSCRMMPEIELFQINAEFCLLLGFFPLGNLFAEATGVFAIKGFDDRFSEGSVVKIVRQHGCPRYRLKNRPMRARSDKHRTNQQNMANPFQDVQP